MPFAEGPIDVDRMRTGSSPTGSSASARAADRQALADRGAGTLGARRHDHDQQHHRAPRRAHDPRRATAALPPGSRVGLIGRNGAGKSTLMKVLVGELEPDDGAIEMPRRTRLGYIAQEAPSGARRPFETVLAADIERAQLLDEAEHCADPDRLGDIHERLMAIDAYTAPSRAASILIGLGFDEDDAGRSRSTASRAAGRCASRWPRCCSPRPTCCCSTSRRTTSTSKRRCGSRTSSRAYPGTLIVISHERDLLNNVVDHILHLQGGKLTLYPGGYDAFERQRAERAAQLAAAQGRAGRAARAAAGLRRAQQRPRLDRQAGPVARQDAGQDAADRRADRRSERSASTSPTPTSCARR